MPGFKAATLRATWNMSVTSVPFSGSLRTDTTKHQMWLRPSVVPAPGTPAASILIQQRDGASQALSTWLQNYSFEALRPRYRIAGSTNGDTNFGSVDIEYLEENSDVGLYITSYQLTTTGWIQATGNNIFSSQLIVSLRVQSGQVAKLVYNNGITPQGRTVRPPRGDTGIQS